MKSVEIAEKIFYSPARNGKAGESITEGAKLIEDYAKKKAVEFFNSIPHQERSKFYVSAHLRGLYDEFLKQNP